MEDYEVAVKKAYPNAVLQSLGKLQRVVKTEDSNDEDALSFYYSDPEAAWENAFKNVF